jgi:hypothetical protein
VPPRGTDFNAFKAKLAQAGLPATELINEGDHYHWGWGAKGAQAAAQSVPGPGAATGAPTAGITGANAADKKTVQTLLDDAKRAETLAGMSRDFVALNRKTSTGPGRAPLEVPIPFAHEEVNVNPIAAANGMSTDLTTMRSITSRMAPMMRPEGSGRIMGQEYSNFLKAAPNIANLGTANADIAKQFATEASTRRAYATFASNWLAEHGSLTGMDAAFAKLKGASSGAQGKIRTYNPKTGNLE